MTKEKQFVEFINKYSAFRITKDLIKQRFNGLMFIILELIKNTIYLFIVVPIAFIFLMIQIPVLLLLKLGIFGRHSITVYKYVIAGWQ
jgi:fatty acid desaturase